MVRFRVKVMARAMDRVMVRFRCYGKCSRLWLWLRLRGYY